MSDQLTDEARDQCVRVQGWLARLSYKPDSKTTVALRDSHARYPVLAFEFSHRVLDSRNPSLEIEVRNQELVPASASFLFDFETFVQWWRASWRHMENHEIDEWILVDGERIFDPHQGQ